MNLSNAKIAVIGLGYVGLPLAAEFGKQRTVLDFVINVAPIAELQSDQDGASRKSRSVCKNYAPLLLA